MSSNQSSGKRVYVRRPVGLARIALLAAGTTFVLTGVCLARSRIIKINASTSEDNVTTASIVVAQECEVKVECDDGNVCTDNTCVDGLCQVANNNAACDDTLFCNGVDTCSGGSCSVHAGDPCAEYDPTGCDESFDCCDGGPPFCLKLSSEGREPTVLEGPTGTVATDQACDTIAVAVVVDAGQTVNILSVSPGDVKMSSVDPAHQALLQSALEAEGLFNDATQDLFFALYNPPDPCTNFKVTVEFTVKGTAPGSDPKAVTHLVAAGTNVKDLENARINNKELNNVQFVEFPTNGSFGVPASSSWALVAMTLALLVGARIRFGGRHTATATSRTP